MKRMLWIILVMGMSSQLPSPLFPVYQEIYHMSNFEITVLSTIYAVGVLLVLLVVEPLCEWFGTKSVANAGVTLAFISTLLYDVNTQPWMLYLARIIGGLSLGAFTSTAIVLVLQNTPKERLSRGLLLGGMMLLLGFGAGPALSGIIAQYMPWYPERIGFWIMLVFLISCSLLMFTISKQVVKQSERKPFKIQFSIPKTGRFLFCTAVGPSVFIAYGFNNIIISLIPTFIRSVIHSTNLAWSGLFIFMLISGGGLVQKSPWPAHPIHRNVGGVFVMALGVWLVLLAGRWSSLVLLSVGIAIQAVGLGLASQSGLQLIGKITGPSERSRILSLYYFIAYVGMIVPTTVTGLLTIWLNLQTSLVCITFAMTLVVAAVGIASKRNMSAPALAENSD